MSHAVILRLEVDVIIMPKAQRHEGLGYFCSPIVVSVNKQTIFTNTRPT